MYEPICPIPGTSLYQGFRTLDSEVARQELLAAWSTPEQRHYNATTKVCEDCKGWGYRRKRLSNGRIEREECGCDTCGGLGKVPALWPARA